MAFGYYDALGILQDYGCNVTLIMQTAKNDRQVIELAIGILYLMEIKQRHG